MANLDSILKCRDITLPTKIHLVKAMVFPVVMYVCESWTVKKAECRRIDAFELWCWGRLLRVPWTARRSNQSILKETSPKYSLERLMLKLKLQYFGHLMWRADWFEKILMMGKTEGRRRRGHQRMRWLVGWHHRLNGHAFGWTLGVGDGQGGLVWFYSWVAKSWTWLSDWIELKMAKIQSTGNTKWWWRFGAAGLSLTVGGNVKWYTATLEDSLPIPHKTNHTLTIQSSYLTPWPLHKGVENSCPHKNLHANVYGSFIHNCQNLEATNALQ